MDAAAVLLYGLREVLVPGLPGVQVPGVLDGLRPGAQVPRRRPRFPWPPRRTRLCEDLALLRGKKQGRPWRKHGNIPL